MQIQTKFNAQQRADQIDAFRAELAILEGEQVLSVDINQRSALTRYHDHLLGQLAAAFDIDATSREKQLSLGMRIASFSGAALGWHLVPCRSGFGRRPLSPGQYRCVSFWL